LPIQNDPRPFGEGDAAWHFSIGDYIASSDEPIYRIPFYIGQWYYNFNPALGPNAPEYPPPNHYNYALMQVAGGERFVPVLLYRAIASFLGIFAVYFLISKLYGTAAAIIASAGLVLSVREQMIYLWGQQPTLISVVVAPITFYAFYRYLESYYQKSPNIAYLYMTVLLLGSQFLLHIQGFVLSVLVLMAFTLLMAIKYRRIPFLAERKLQLLFSALLLLAITLPFIMIYIGTPQLGLETPDYGRLFSWGIDPNLVAASYPSDFTSFSSEYPSWALPVILFGIGITILRRRSQDLLMLGWLVGVYLVIHTDLYLGVSVERAARMLISEPALFYSFIGIGAVSWLSFLRIQSTVRIISKFVIVLIFVFLIFQSDYEVSKNTLSNSYVSIFRITPAQSELAAWIGDNVPDDSYLYYIPEYDPFNLGSWQYQKLRWILASSQRYVVNYQDSFTNNSHTQNTQRYFIFDYTDLDAILNSQPNPLQPAAQQSKAGLQQYEAANFNVTNAIYDRNQIRVYQVDSTNFQ